MTTPVAVILVALLSLTMVDSTIVSSCLTKNQETMLGVQLSGCEAAPCILQKNTTVTIEITFIPDRDLKQIKHSVHGKMSGISMPFVGVDGTTACNNVFQEDKVTRASCPLAAGTTYVYQYQLRVLPSYPNVNVIIHWGLQDVEQRQDVACFETQAKIVRKIIK